MDERIPDERLEEHKCLFPQNSELAHRFQILRTLGSGGMGNVYLAKDIQLSRYVAIKTVHPELAADEVIRRRIAHECRFHAAVGIHPNIVALYDRIEIASNVYLIMEYIDGVLLSDLLASQSPLATSFGVRKVIEIVLQILEGLATVHSKDIIHRDIKPSNIIIKDAYSEKPLVKLMDFGIARMEEEEIALTRLTSLETGGPGTPMYMAPERIDKETFGDICAATDLYSVGVILFQMLSDGPPFRGTMTEIFLGHLTRPPDMSLLSRDIPYEFRTVIDRALQKFPKDRYMGARFFGDELKKLIEQRLVSSSIDASLEKTLLINDLTKKYRTSGIVQNGTEKKKNPLSLNLYDKRKIIIWTGVIVAMVIAGSIAGSKIAESIKNETSKEQNVVNIPQPQRERESEPQPTIIDLPDSQTSTNQEPVIPERKSLAPGNRTSTDGKQDSASKAFEAAVQDRRENETRLNLGKSEKKIDNEQVEFSHSRLKETKANKEAGNGERCQTLMKSWQLGDSSTMKQYHRECTN